MKIDTRPHLQHVGRKKKSKNAFLKWKYLGYEAYTDGARMLCLSYVTLHLRTKKKLKLVAIHLTITVTCLIVCVNLKSESFFFLIWFALPIEHMIEHIKEKVLP